MNIKVSDLKMLQKLTSGLKSNNILPIYDYLRFDKGTITKISSGSFIVFDCEDSDETILVDEKLLYVKVANTSAPMINITQKGNKVTITDGITPTHFQKQNIKEWPEMPDYGNEKIELSSDFNAALQKSLFFPVHSEEIPSLRSFLMIGNNHFCASDAGILFYEEISENIELVIQTKSAEVLSKTTLFKCSTNDNWMFFWANRVVIGFQKQEIKFTDMRRFKMPEEIKLEFVGSKADFFSFNSECIGSSKYPFVTIKTGVLSFDDTGLDIQLDRKLDYLTPSEIFTYNAAHMNRLLNSFNGDELEFYRGSTWYWIKSPDEAHVTVINRLVPQG